MHRLPDVVVTEDGEPGRRVADSVVGCLQRLQADEVVGSIGQRRVSDIGDGTHAAQSHVRAPGQQAGADDIVIRFRLAVTVQHVLESVHEAGATVHETEHGLDVNVREHLEQRVVDCRSGARSGQRPAPAPLPPELLVLTRRNAAIDLEQAPFEQLLKPVQVLANRFLKDREPRAGN